MVVIIAALSQTAEHSITSGYGPGLNVTETARVRVLEPNSVTEVIVEHVEAGGDYILVNEDGRERPFLHKLSIAFLTRAVAGTGKVLSVLLTLGTGPGVLALFPDPTIVIPQVIRDHEATLHTGWRYVSSNDLKAARSPSPNRFTSETIRALNDVWVMVDGKTELNPQLHPAPEVTEGGERDHVTAKVLLEEGRVAFEQLLASSPNRTTSRFFGAMYQGDEVICEIKLRVHDGRDDQVLTRAAWSGSARSPVELNPTISCHAEVNAAFGKRAAPQLGSSCRYALAGLGALRPVILRRAPPTVKPTVGLVVRCRVPRRADNARGVQHRHDYVGRGHQHPLRAPEDIGRVTLSGVACHAHVPGLADDRSPQGERADIPLARQYLSEIPGTLDLYGDTSGVSRGIRCVPRSVLQEPAARRQVPQFAGVAEPRR